MIDFDCGKTHRFLSPTELHQNNILQKSNNIVILQSTNNNNL